MPGLVFTAGDNAYPHGSADDFRRCYDPTWGRHRTRTRPSPGNHDYESPGARPYYDYFGGAAGPHGLGYYSYGIGAWRAYSLNSNVSADPGSAQYAWLQAELASSPSRCSLAYWHHPVLSSGPNGDQRQMRAVWKLLHQHGVEVVIAGHDHLYERYSPMDGDLRADPSRGIRQFVVGTGGYELYPFTTIKPHSEARAAVLGVIRFTLRAGGYDWEFVPVPGEPFRDAGSGVCH
jgi:hypothetical protein